MLLPMKTSVTFKEVVHSNGFMWGFIALQALIGMVALPVLGMGAKTYVMAVFDLPASQAVMPALYAGSLSVLFLGINTLYLHLTAARESDEGGIMFGISFWALVIQASVTAMDAFGAAVDAGLFTR